MSLTEEAINKIKDASKRGISLKNSNKYIGSVKTLEYILQECKGYGFNSQFCDFIKSLNAIILKGTRRSSEEILNNFQQNETNLENLGDLLILMEKQLKDDSNKKYGFRYNQLVALCAFLLPVKVKLTSLSENIYLFSNFSG